MFSQWFCKVFGWAMGVCQLALGVCQLALGVGSGPLEFVSSPLEFVSSPLGFVRRPRRPEKHVFPREMMILDTHFFKMTKNGPLGRIPELASFCILPTHSFRKYWIIMRGLFPHRQYTPVRGTPPPSATCSLYTFSVFGNVTTLYSNF